MAARKSTVGATARSMLSKEDLDRLVDELISEKAGKVSGRIREYLTTPDVKGALDKLVDAKIPVKDIHTKIISKLGWKVSPSVFRAFMKEEYNYPEPNPKRKPPGARKSAAKSSPAKAKPRARSAAKPRRGS